MNHQLLKDLMIQNSNDEETASMMMSRQDSEQEIDYNTIRIARLDTGDGSMLFVRSSGVDSADYSVDAADSVRGASSASESETNPFLVNRSQRYGLSRLFLSSNPDETYESAAQFEFNTDTKIGFLGGLTIWQLTAVLISIIMLFALGVYLVRKMNAMLKEVTANRSELTPNSNTMRANDIFTATTNSRNSSLRTSYSSSTDSTNQLISKNFSFNPNRFIDSVGLDKYKAVPNFV